MNIIAEKGITLELCPTSNLNTKIVNDIKDYPIDKIINNKIATKDKVITTPISPSQKSPLYILDARINTKHTISKHFCQILNLPSIFITSFFLVYHINITNTISFFINNLV